MKIIVRSFILLIIFLTCLFSTGCTQTDDLVNLNDEVAIDADGNVYKTVTINDQIWMAENLKTTRYCNGDLIDPGPNPPKTYPYFLDLSKESEPKYQWPCNGEEDHVTMGGRLYTWYAAMDNRSICPVGWHLPSDEEWQSLKTFLTTHDYGRYTKEGKRKVNADIGIALASGIENWASAPKSTFLDEDFICNDYTEHNTTGFSAMPSGLFCGDFVYPGLIAIWRSTSPVNSWSLDYMGTDLDSGGIQIPWTLWNIGVYGIKPYDGYSVRCIKDGADAGQDSIYDGIINLTISNPTVLIRSSNIYVEITSDGGSTITERGLCWNTAPTPTIDLPTKTANGSGKGQFLAEITGLTSSTTYFIRAYATNKYGTTYSREIQFTTKDEVVDYTTFAAFAITAYTATSGGNVISDRGSAVTTRGVCWNTSPDPTISNNKTTDGTGIGSYTSSITGLTAKTLYYVRAYFINGDGTVYGNQQSFTTSNTVNDIDGNMYNTVKIGAQTWMVENLKTTKYNDGTSIPLISEGTAWSALSSPGYCLYNNVADNMGTYGVLYNWYTVNTAKLAPIGWHVPTDTEWTALENYLIANGFNFDGTTTGNKIGKSMAATSQWAVIYGWASPSTTGTIGNDFSKNNTSGFAGFPGGFHSNDGFYGVGDYGYWWSSTQNGMNNAWYRYLSNYYSGVYENYCSKQNGYSVRCLKD